jgi:hypothetical protein
MEIIIAYGNRKFGVLRGGSGIIHVIMKYQVSVFTLYGTSARIMQEWQIKSSSEERKE